VVERSPVVSRVLECAIAVHRELGPGLLESTYESCLAFELTRRHIPYRRQVSLPVRYHEHVVDNGYRVDFIVEDAVVLEIKAVERMAPAHFAQVRTYLKLTGLRRGLIINFNAPTVKQGLYSFIRSGACESSNPE
jgi:GxxExxY protein